MSLPDDVLRGFSRYQARDWGGAMLHWTAALQVLGSDPYCLRALLWLAERRNGKELPGRGDMPAPREESNDADYRAIAAYLMGRQTEDEFLDVPWSPDRSKSPVEVCRGRFFAGSKWLIVDANRGMARYYLLQAAKTDLAGLPERETAAAELPQLSEPSLGIIDRILDLDQEAERLYGAMYQGGSEGRESYGFSKDSFSEAIHLATGAGYPAIARRLEARLHRMIGIWRAQFS